MKTTAYPHNENLLEHILIRWRFGYLEGLVWINSGTLQHHPDRAKLALLAASGHLQTDDTSKARQFTHMALDWGCSMRLVSQILVAGVYNKLDREVAIRGGTPKGLQHCKTSLATGSPSNKFRLYAQAHTDVQLKQMTTSAEIETAEQQPGETVGMEKIQYEGITLKKNNLDSIKARIPEQDFVSEIFDVERDVEAKNILVIFSSPRSGSTMLCDIFKESAICLAHEYF